MFQVFQILKLILGFKLFVVTVYRATQKSAPPLYSSTQATYKSGWWLILKVI